MTEPAHGWVKLHDRLHAVHAHVHDHMPAATRVQRFNRRMALAITRGVGTMACFWVFCLFALLGLPAALYQSHVIGTVGFITAAGFLIMVQFWAQSFAQLVLLPALMVGQNLQNEAADARAAKTFEDVEKVLDRLDTHTQGGLREVLDAIAALKKSP